jgi:tetratricopeptide (TPR) repeat protein
MHRIIVSIFFVLTLFCSTVMSETAANWFNKADELWDGEKFTDPKKAVEYLNNAIKLQPNYASAYNSRGNAYADLGKYQRAIEDYNQAIRVKPDYAYAYINRGDAYYGLGQYRLAIEDCNKAIRLQPDHAVAYSNRGKAYAKLGQYKLAIKDFNEAIHLHPDDVNAYNNRGVVYLLQGNKNLGCLDAQKACAMGFCKVLEWAKRKGHCLEEQFLKPGKDEVKITPANTSAFKNPKKQLQLPLKYFKSSEEEEQSYKSIKGIVLMNGNRIEGQIISMNPDTVKIYTKDGSVLSYDFKKEVKGFIKE